MIEPIHKRKVVQIATGAIPQDYTITDSEGVQIYAGRVYPVGGVLAVEVQDICADALSHLSIADLTTTAQTDTKECRVFTVAGTDDDATPTTYKTWQCWDYVQGDVEDNAVLSLNKPITGVYPSGMPVPVSVLTAGVITHKLQGAVGLPVCDPWALYYFNSLGGWDVLYLAGGVKIVENYTREEFKDGTRRRVNWRNGIERQYECRTGWLKGTQGEHLYELVGSTDVWLWHSGEFLPVVVDDSTCEFRNYHNNGNTPVNVTITVTLAEERIRQ